jgi:hypothetical protein
MGSMIYRAALTLDEVRSPDIRRLHDYWVEHRSGGAIPAKSRIDPADIPSCLAYLTLSEIHRGPFRIRYRLIGTEVAWLRGGDVTGQWLHEIERWGASTIADFLEFYEATAAGSVLLGATRAYWVDGRECAYEWIMLPLSEDGSAVTHCLEMEDPRWGREHGAG